MISIYGGKYKKEDYLLLLEHIEYDTPYARCSKLKGTKCNHCERKIICSDIMRLYDYLQEKTK